MISFLISLKTHTLSLSFAFSVQVCSFEVESRSYLFEQVEAGHHQFERAALCCNLNDAAKTSFHSQSDEKLTEAWQERQKKFNDQLNRVLDLKNYL